MARHVGRSRGCQACRRRKIKCDEKIPECSQCHRTGRKCPGALVGPLFIAMSKEKADAATINPISLKSCGVSIGNIPSRYIPLSCHWPPEPGPIMPLSRSTDDGAHSEFEKERNDGEASGVQSCISPTLASQTHHSVWPPSAVAAQFQLPKSYQPSRAVPFQQFFLTHFIDFFFNPKAKIRANAWINGLPKLLAASSTPALRYSIRAATMAIYGKLTRHEPIEFEACRWYDRSLESQRMQLQTMNHRSRKTVDESTIVVPLLLCFFEIILCTEDGAWMRHNTAAEGLLEMIGPQSCRTGLFNDIFFSVRLGAFYVSLSLKRPSIFASEAWCTIPFELTNKSPFDNILDIMLRIHHCSKYCSEMVELSTHDVPASNVARLNLEASCLELISHLDEYWNRYGNEIDDRYDYTRYREPWDASLWDSGVHVFSRDTFAATVIAQYDGARILLNRFLAGILPNPRVYEERIMLHSASALSAARYHEVSEAATGGTVSMIFPLKVVSQSSPSAAQRNEAEAALQRWGAERGIGGICT